MSIPNDNLAKGGPADDGFAGCPPGRKYELGGPQVQPDASYWAYCPQLRLVRIDELTEVTDSPKTYRGTLTGPYGYFPPYDPKQNVAELDELFYLAERRDDPECLVHFDGKPDPTKAFQRLPVSKFFGYMPFAVGAVQAGRLPCDPDYAETCGPTGNSLAKDQPRSIRTGRGMARAVEAETPGIFHRQAVNFLILQRSWSPPLQALVWAALDVTIASALQAAWYYKWHAADPHQVAGKLVARPFTSFRPRPVECRHPKHGELSILYDAPDELNPLRTICPQPSPGTPRHPAYPSGHSTFSAAASELLAYFFAEETEELTYLADNIGVGRMWAGVHWRSDHSAGQMLGRTVAQLVIRQLEAIRKRGKAAGIDLCPPRPKRQPTIKCLLEGTIKAEIERVKGDCPTGAIPDATMLKNGAAAFAERCADEPRELRVQHFPIKTAVAGCKQPPNKALDGEQQDPASGPPGQSVQAGAL